MTAPVQVGPSLSGGGPVRFLDVDGLLADIGDRIRSERLARGWSRTDLADRAGISAGAVRRLEDGSVWLRALMKACLAFRIQVNYLLSDQWQVPERRPSLGVRQVEILQAAGSGGTLGQVGDRLGMGSQAVASALSKIYVRLGVSDLPQDQRRSAAVRVAVEYGLMPDANRTS